MDRKVVAKLEKAIEEAVVDVVARLGLRGLPLLPSQRTMHLMAKAAVAVYETAVEMQGEQACEGSGTTLLSPRAAADDCSHPDFERSRKEESTMPADQPESEPSPPPSGGTGIPPEELKKAYQAFKKRLKLTRLDDESRLGHRATTSGGKSSIQAIQPPKQYPKTVWDELVRRGKLRYVGQGLYELGAK